MLPSLWLELVRIFTVQVFTSMHHIYLIVDLLALLDEDRRFAIWATTDWERSIHDGLTAISWDDRVYS